MHGLTLAEEERKYLANPLNHQVFVHPRASSIRAGASSILGGIVALGLAFHWPKVVLAFFALSLWVPLLIQLSRDLVPCKCSKTFILTAKIRAAIPRRQTKRCKFGQFILMSVTIVLSILASLLLAAWSIETGVGTAAVLMLLGGALIIGGCATITAGVLNKLPTGQLVISEDEQQEIAALRGETEEELHRLIAFHLKAGNFSQADDYSRTLLAMSENAQLQSPKTQQSH